MANFNGPVPGESLTKPPKSFPWERPPEMVDRDDVAQFYLKTYSDPDRAEAIIDLLELGVPMKDVVQGAMRTGVSKGLHTIDVGLLVAPILHEHFKTVADNLGVKYNEGFVDTEAKAQKRRAVEAAKARKVLAGIKVDE